MAKATIAHPAHTVVPDEPRERGTCSGCDTTTKSLTAPRPNVGHGYRGAMYCLPCNPRFGGDMLRCAVVRPGEDGQLIKEAFTE